MKKERDTPIDLPNLDAFRLDFPIFRRPMKNGHPLIYLDNAATTQKPWQVLEALQKYYQQQNANIHRGIYQLAAEATAAYEAVRAKAQQFIGAARTEEVVFVKGTTDAVNLVATAFLSPQLQPGDEVIISAMEHHSNLIPWQIICQAHQAKLRVIPMTEKGELMPDGLAQMLNPKTKMLAIVHVSNSLGTINPVDEMIELAHEAGVPVLVDGAQSIVSEKIDVQQMDCDFFAFSGHKLFGPTGTGVLYGKAKHLKGMAPYQYGGEMIRSVTFEKTNFARIPHKLEAGTPNIAGIIALGAAMDYVQKIGQPNIKAHLQALLAYGTAALDSVPGLRIIGQADRKSSILSFVMEGAHPHDIATILNEYGIAVRAGHHCTQPIMDFYQIPATTRASFSIYNRLEEIDHLRKALLEVKNIFS
ncbi:MAG: cysteine desulfurase [Bacteroidota bacterium]